jgi:hypothetical protein
VEDVQPMSEFSSGDRFLEDDEPAGVRHLLTKRQGNPSREDDHGHASCVERFDECEHLL